MEEKKLLGVQKESKSGLQKLSALHIVLIIGVAIVAAVFIAKFGFGADLLSPSSGEMAIVKRPPVVTPASDIVRNDVAVHPVTSLRLQTIVPCDAPKRTCGDSCVDIYTDPNNCGACGRVCSEVYKDRANIAEFSCADAHCTIRSCKPGFGYCDLSPRLDLNSECSYNFKTGVTNNYDGDYIYDTTTPGSAPYPAEISSCGGCGNTCPANGKQHFAYCENSACHDVCWGAWSSCDNDWSNGCETGWDNNNCGACGAKCPTNALCNINTGCCVLRSDQSKTTADSTGTTCSGHAWNRMLS